MTGQDTKTECEPCHTQLWNALGYLHQALDEFQGLYDQLAGEDRPEAGPADKSPAPPFAMVLAGATKRVTDARDNVDKLRTDFERLCLHGAESS